MCAYCKDIFEPNVVAATERDAQRDTRLTAGRVYLIDFESCRQFERGPGAQAAVTLPPAHVKPPHGMKCLDPFSWDIYCLGATLEAILDVRNLGSKCLSATSHPRICLYRNTSCLNRNLNHGSFVGLRSG